MIALFKCEVYQELILLAYLFINFLVVSSVKQSKCKDEFEGKYVKGNVFMKFIYNIELILFIK